MALNQPTILYPNGSEVIKGTSVSILWNPSKPHSTEALPVWYEIFFTDRYDGEETNWSQIATIPAGYSSFDWKIPPSIKGKSCRVAIRSRDHRGFRGEMSVSAADFTISGKSLLTPSVISPVEGSRYRFFVPFIFDHYAVFGSSSQRAFYEISYMSLSKGIDWTIIRSDLPVGFEPFQWDIRDIQPDNDYVVRILLYGDDGEVSVPIFINNLTLSPLNYFYLDTLPPKGTIVNQSKKSFSNTRDMIFKMTAFDAATGVRSVTLQQVEGDTVSAVGTKQDMSNVKTFHIEGEDGVKYIEAIFSDYGNNVEKRENTSKSFRTFLSNENLEVADVLVIKNGTVNIVYSAFNGDLSYIYKDNGQILSFDNKITCMAYFDGVVYFAHKDSSEIGGLNKIDGSSYVSVHDFSDTDSVVNSMCVFDGELYMGLRTGELYKFDGSSVSYVTSMSNTISGLRSDGTILYVLVDNQEGAFVYDGLTFSNIGTSNAYRQI